MIIWKFSDSIVSLQQQFSPRLSTMRTTAGLRFLYVYMKYDKQPIALLQQLKLLEQRGLIIQNEEIALSQLQSISYFRLASYWHSMEVPNSDKHQFLPNSNFDDVIELYQFDKKLRTLVFTSIQDIEIALRTRIIQCFSLKYGAFWFMDVRLFKNESIFAACLENIQKEVNRSNEDFLKEHFKKYEAKFSQCLAMAIWAVHSNSSGLVLLCTCLMY